MKESSRSPIPRLAYSPEEAAQALHLSLATIYRMVYDGKLPSKRTGGRRSRIIIPAKALEEWLDQAEESGGQRARRRNDKIVADLREKRRRSG